MPKLSINAMKSNGVQSMLLTNIWNIYNNITKKFEKFINKSKAREYILIFIIANIAVIFLALRTPAMTYDHPDFYMLEWDQHKYIQMANELFSNNSAPFCYRILMPSIVYFMPFEIQMSFYMLTYIFIVATAFLVHYFLRKMQFNIAYSLTGMFLFLSLGYATRFQLYAFWYVDSLAFLIAMGIMCLIVDKDNKKNDILLSIAFFLGVLAKESVLFLFPIYYTFRAKRFLDGKVALKSILIILPSVIAFILVRMMIPNYSDYELGSHFGYCFGTRLHELSFGQIRGMYTFGTFGVLLLTLPFFNIKHNFKLFLKFLPFIILVYSQMLLALTTERLLILAFPALIPMAIFGLKSLVEQLHIKSTLVIPLAFIVFIHLLLSSRMMPELLDQAVIFIIYLGILFYLSINKPWVPSPKCDKKSIADSSHKKATAKRKGSKTDIKKSK